MASLTIRKLDDEIKTRLRAQAARNNRSMEEEARLILRGAVNGDEKDTESKPDTRNIVDVIRSYFGPENGVELELPPRDVAREPPRFE